LKRSRQFSLGDKNGKAATLAGELRIPAGNRKAFSRYLDPRVTQADQDQAAGDIAERLEKVKQDFLDFASYSIKWHIN
jgi:hypothetical protein